MLEEVPHSYVFNFIRNCQMDDFEIIKFEVNYQQISWTVRDKEGQKLTFETKVAPKPEVVSGGVDITLVIEEQMGMSSTGISQSE